jgi:hypothetical protein
VKRVGSGRQIVNGGWGLAAGSVSRMSIFSEHGEFIALKARQLLYQSCIVMR